MTKNIVITVLMGLALTTFSSCKTSEKNYREAYELAQQKKQASADPETDKLIEKENVIPSVKIDGINLPVKTEYTYPVKDLDGFNSADFKKYNIVIASFRQLFNAKSVRKRAIEAGFEKAFIVYNRDKVYFVIAQSCETPAQAEVALKNVTKVQPVVLKEPFPYVMRRP